MKRFVKWLFLLLFALSLLVGNTGFAVAQDRVDHPSRAARPGTPAPASPDVDEQKTPQIAVRDYAALVQEVFAPITDQLNLSKEQEFQIIAIITGAEVKADLLVQQLDGVEQQLTEATLTDSPDEATINRLSAQEAFLLTRMIAMKARAKAGIYLLLTPAQRMLVSQKFRNAKSVSIEDLGGISIY